MQLLLHLPTEARPHLIRSSRLLVRRRSGLAHTPARGKLLLNAVCSFPFCHVRAKVHVLWVDGAHRGTSTFLRPDRASAGWCVGRAARGSARAPPRAPRVAAAPNKHSLGTRLPTHVAKGQSLGKQHAEESTSHSSRTRAGIGGLSTDSPPRRSMSTGRCRSGRADVHLHSDVGGWLQRGTTNHRPHASRCSHPRVFALGGESCEWAYGRHGDEHATNECARHRLEERRLVVVGDEAADAADVHHPRPM